MYNGKAIVWVIILILIGLGVYALVSKTSTTTDEVMVGEEVTVTEEVDSMMSDKGAYIPYSADKLALADDGDVVLFFRASWCPTCRTLDSDIRANLEDIPDGVVILDVDYDNSTALKQKYGVTYQHTLVQVDSQGNQIAKWQGSPSLSALLSEIK